MTIVTELVTEFKFNGSLKPLDDFRSGIIAGGKAVAIGAASIAAGTAAIFAFTESTLSAVDAQAQLAETIGVSIENIQALGFAASVSGSSLDAVQSSLSGLSRKIGEAATQGSEDFARLGINVRDSSGRVKDAAQIFTEVSSAFSRLNLSESERANFAEKLGIDQSLLQLLSKSRGELKALTDEAREFGIVTEEQAPGVVLFNDSITRLKFGFSSLFQQVSIALAPEFKDLADTFSTLLKENKKFIAEGVQETIDFFKQLSKTSNTLFGDFGVLKGGIALVGGAFALAFPQFSLFSAAFLGVASVVDDLIVAFDGGDSVIKNFFSQFDIDIVNFLKSTGDAFSKFFAQVKDGLNDIFLGIFELIEKLNELGQFLGGQAFEGVQKFKEISKELSNSDNVFEVFGEKTPVNFGGGGNIVTGAGGIPFALEEGVKPTVQTVSGIPVSNDASINQEISINIQSTDPRQAAIETKKVLQQSINEAAATVKIGGR